MVPVQPEEHHGFQVDRRVVFEPETKFQQEVEVHEVVVPDEQPCIGALHLHPHTTTDEFKRYRERAKQAIGSQPTTQAEVRASTPFSQFSEADDAWVDEWKVPALGVNTGQGNTGGASSSAADVRPLASSTPKSHS